MEGREERRGDQRSEVRQRMWGYTSIEGTEKRVRDRERMMARGPSGRGKRESE